LRGDTGNEWDRELTNRVTPTDTAIASSGGKGTEERGGGWGPVKPGVDYEAQEYNLQLPSM
jgi:hypothetical protein